MTIVALRVELKRWQPLFTLCRTTASTTGSCAATSGTSLATTALEKPPNWLPRRSRESAKPNSSFISLTEERAERVLKRDGQPDCSRDDESAEPVRLSCRRHVRGSTPATEAGAWPRRARNLPAAVHKHQRRYALDGE